MSPLLQMDEGQVQSFIYGRALAHPGFRAVIAVSVEKYPSGFSAIIWVGQEPTTEMRQFAYDLESELANLGIACTIIVKTDRELPFGGRYELQTERGPFTYRYYRIDPVKDEDLVYIFVLYKGASTYRFRLSLTGTLASMLRARNKIDEDRILEVYLDRIKALLASEVTPEKVYDVMFSSKDLRLFAGD